MRVLVLGGTGSIGGPIVRELILAGHELVALARSEASAKRLAHDGAGVIRGDIAKPGEWLPMIPVVDAVIHVAATFTDDEASIDRRLLDGLLPFFSGAARAARFIYTGGCWLFGGNDGSVTTEETPYDPLPAYAWSVPHIARIQSTSGIHPIVIHPAMVYTGDGGVFAQFCSDAQSRHAVRVVGSEHVRWPLVHADDLAVLYRLALEHSPPGVATPGVATPGVATPGESYIACAIDGLPVGRIARAFARRFNTRELAPEIISADEIAAEVGDWGRGYALDQVQSGDKARRELGWVPRHVDPVLDICVDQ